MRLAVAAMRLPRPAAPVHAPSWTAASRAPLMPWARTLLRMSRAPAPAPPPPLRLRGVASRLGCRGGKATEAPPRAPQNCNACSGCTRAPRGRLGCGGRGRSQRNLPRRSLTLLLLALVVPEAQLDAQLLLEVYLLRGAGSGLGARPAAGDPGIEAARRAAPHLFALLALQVLLRRGMAVRRRAVGALRGGARRSAPGRAAEEGPGRRARRGPPGARRCAALTGAAQASSSSSSSAQELKFCAGCAKMAASSSAVEMDFLSPDFFFLSLSLLLFFLLPLAFLGSASAANMLPVVKLMPLVVGAGRGSGGWRGQGPRRRRAGAGYAGAMQAARCLCGAVRGCATRECGGAGRCTCGGGAGVCMGRGMCAPAPTLACASSRASCVLTFFCKQGARQAWMGGARSGHAGAAAQHRQRAPPAPGSTL
jgi:hypothetical protein